MCAWDLQGAFRSKVDRHSKGFTLAKDCLAMSQPPDILQKILKRKTEEIAERAEYTSLRQLSAQIEAVAPPRAFVGTIQEKIDDGHLAVIAEIKKASPSKGVIRSDFDPIAIAKSYAAAGATALSVLTDHDFFQGHEDYLKAARVATKLPVLRKDFIIDPYQVYEARVIGADCILLIVAALGDPSLSELFHLAEELGMDVLMEVHDAEELQRALQLEAKLIGINNRNLRTFETRLETTLDLLDNIPGDRIVVTESGIHSKKDVDLMREHRVHAFLIGETFMRSPDPGEKLRELFGG